MVRKTSLFARGLRLRSRLGQPARGRILVVACTLALVVPPAAAWATTQSTYVGPGASICCWTGYDDGGTYKARDYNQDYHSCASYTSNGSSVVEYEDQNFNNKGAVQDGYGFANCVNPIHQGGTQGNARYAFCGASNGGTTNVTNVTCQTTRP